MDDTSKLPYQSHSTNDRPPLRKTKKMSKTIHIHLGPHKTGSTAIQDSLRSHRKLLAEAMGLHWIDYEITRKVALELNRNNGDAGDETVSALVRACERQLGDCVISCEDLSGDLPGRSAKRRPYPVLLANLRFLAKIFAPHKCIFYFFERDPEAWLKSAYSQNIIYRAKFSSIEQFKSFIKFDEIWSVVLEKVEKEFGDQFVRIPYLEGEDFYSTASLLQQIAKQSGTSVPDIKGTRSNQKPADGIISVVEFINKSTASNYAKRNAKMAALGKQRSKVMSTDGVIFPKWAGEPTKPEWLASDLESLWERSCQRVHNQKQPNLLPDPFVDLMPYRTHLIDAPESFPEGGRQAMENQYKILQYRFRGMPETCALLGLTISYLRRRTAHTEHAAFLFQRLWEEEHEILLGTLQTRWLISTFQTFMDHGADENQRLIGGSAYFFSNMLKAYEAERALDGLDPDSIYPNSHSVTKNGFAGLDRFSLGGSDLLLNTNALLLEISGRETRSGRVVQEFLLRLKSSKTIFSRMDSSRLAHEIDNPQFANCWSFFEEPKR
jgi:hypothetical protein